MSAVSRSGGWDGLGRRRRGGWPLFSVLLALLPSALSAQTAAVRAEPGCPVFEPAGASTPAIAHVRYLAADALEGREVGSLGERCTTAYLATRFSELGLRPGGADGSWYQTFPVRSGSVEGSPGALQISGRPQEQGKAWTPFGFSGSGQATGRLVYVGPGVAMPGLPADDYVRVDLTGAVAVVEATWEGVTGLRADPHLKASVAQGRGAVAVLILLPEGASFPSLENENRPFLNIPVAAVSGADAQAVRLAAGAGDAARLAADVRPRVVEGRNVAALLPGSDPALSEQLVVVGAHHDHLGWGGEGSLAPNSRAIHNGADDNASGTASLIVIAERLLAGPRLARSVLFLGFGGEERGLLGSSYYVENPLRPLASTVAMINLDMVGRLEDGPLTIFGMATATEWEDLVRAAAAEQARPVALTLLPDGFGPSDHSAFYGKGIPVLHFFTGTHSDYHRPEDDAERVDGAGLETVAALAATVTARLTGTALRASTPLTAIVSADAPHAPGAPGDATTSGGYGPYFGSIPDMTPLEFGVRLTGVREGSPAAVAGLREGDVLVSFGGKPTSDLYAYTYALQEHAPGDRVEIVVLRGGERVTLSAVLTERP